jgi:hypothetical protein
VSTTPWQLELVKIAERLEAKTKQTRWTERTEMLLEREFIAGAYAMVKVLQSSTGSDETLRRRIPVRRLESGYDVEHSSRDTIPVAALCRQILNNAVFDFYCGETADLFDGIYIAPDPDERTMLLVIASDFIALCNDLGTGNV